MSIVFPKRMIPPGLPLAKGMLSSPSEVLNSCASSEVRLVPITLIPFGKIPKPRNDDQCGGCGTASSARCTA